MNTYLGTEFCLLIKINFGLIGVARLLSFRVFNTDRLSYQFLDIIILRSWAVLRFWGLLPTYLYSTYKRRSAFAAVLIEFSPTWIYHIPILLSKFTSYRFSDSARLLCRDMIDIWIWPTPKRLQIAAYLLPAHQIVTRGGPRVAYCT